MRVLLFILMLIFPAVLYAAAWPQGKGKGQVIDTVSLYVTDTYFGPDSYRYTFSQLPFAKIENSVYAEYGWSDTMTLGFKTNYQYNELDTPIGEAYSYGLGDTEFFIRQMLWKDEDEVISLQPLVKIPSPWGRDLLLPVTTRGFDAELRLLYGYGFELWGLPHFHGSEIGYRQRMSDASNEWHVDETLGLRITPGFMLLAQGFVTLSEATNFTNFAVTNSSDYDLVKGQLSVVAKLTDRVSMQAGVYEHVLGRNTGAGGGIFLSLWVDF